MRRRELIGQIVLGVVAGLSVVILVATACLWVRSYRVTDQWRDENPQRGIMLYSNRGTVTFHYINLVYPPHVLRQLEELGEGADFLGLLTGPPSWVRTGRNFASYPVRPATDRTPGEDAIGGVRRDIRLLGFQWYANEGFAQRMFAEGSGNNTMIGPPRLIVVIPLWAVVLLSLPLPLIWLRVNRPSRRWARRGLCPGCGYDVRESPDRCPECGVSRGSS